MLEQLTYKGSLTAEIHSISGLEKPPAIFNGTLLKIDNKLLLFPRIVTRQRAGVTDMATAVGRYEIDPKTFTATCAETIPIEQIRGEHRGLFTNDPFPEDMRGIILADGSVMFGLTAAGLDGTPHAAILTVQPPCKPEDFTQMNVLNELPSMKNILPIQATIIAGRPEVARGVKQQIIFAHFLPEKQTWEIIPDDETTFPENIPWVGANGRFGLCGWNDRVPIQNKPGYFRFLIHGYNKDHGIVEYAIGLAEGFERPDKTFAIIGVDKKPLLTYAEAVAQVARNSWNCTKEPDPHKHTLYSLGGLPTNDGILLTASLYDKEIHFWIIPHATMLRDFSIQ